MKIRKTKKGFTIVELVIVIAVIGILAAILIPTFIGLTNRANEASDNALVKNLNTALKMEEQTAGHEKSVSMQGAIDDLKNQGYLLNQISSKSGKVLVWDQQENQFLLNDAENGPKDDVRYWRIANNDSEFNAFKGHYSVYAGEGWTSKQAFGFTYGFDAGEKNVIEEVRYSSTDTNEVVIRTHGDQIVLNVYAPNKDVQFYGFAKEVNVLAAAPNSLHIHGSVNELAVQTGHVQIEPTGIVFDIVQFGSIADHAAPGNAGSISNSGYVAETSYSKHTSGEGGTAPSQAQIDSANDKVNAESAKEVGGDFEIATLAQLESFRDAVNAGNDFKGLEVKLVKDIELKDGWRPIGEGSRKVMKGSTEAQGLTTFFNGIFDGQNHTIKNLNNKGFVPTKARLVKDEFKDKNNNPFTVDTYAYGLFALVKGATIKNVNVEIDFDQARYQDAKADSVGGAVGYAIQGVTLENIKVSGKIAAQDCASGIIGRISLESYTASIKDCTNNANITSEVVASGIARVYVPSAGHSLTLTNNTNNGNVVTLGSQGYYGGIAVYNQGITNYTFNNNINKGQSVTTTVLSGGNIRLD